MSHACRKNVATMGDTERDAYIAAVLKLKSDGTYDGYVQIHLDMFFGIAHRGIGFLPWHRELLRRFEEDLRIADAALRGGPSTLSIPYWDWTTNRSTTALPWTTAFLGGNGNAVTGIVGSGPFRSTAGDWTITIGDSSPVSPELRRNMGDKSFPQGWLPEAFDVTTTKAVPDYLDFRASLENLHNVVHNWVAGNMMAMTSPNDPIFFLHHCVLDKIWAEWQALHPLEVYPPAGGGLRQGEGLDESMPPWLDKTPADVLVHSSLGYRYDTELLCNIDLPKVITDQPKLKIFDMGMTTPRFDPVKLPALDGPITDPRIDWVKTVALDKMPGLDSVATDPRIDWVKTTALDKMPTLDFQPPAGPIPFLLSTAHHAPTATEHDGLAELDTIWRQNLTALGGQYALGELSPEREQEFLTLRTEYHQFREEMNRASKG